MLCFSKMLIAKSEEKGGVDAINVGEVDLEEEAMEIIIMEASLHK